MTIVKDEMKERKQRRMVDRIARNKASRNIGIAIGSLLSLLYVILTYSTSLPFCIDTTAQFYGGNGIFQLTVAGGVEILCALGVAILTIYALVKLYVRYLWVPVLMLVATGFIFTPPYVKIPEKVREAETKQGLHSFQLALERYYTDFAVYPGNLNALSQESYMSEFPCNAWRKYKRYKSYNKNVECLFSGDSKPLKGSETSRFGTEGVSMGNVSTGYDIGRELVPWCDAYTEKGKPSKEQATIRGILAGNFVYLPCDEARKPIPFSQIETIPIDNYILIAFGSPYTMGLDIWTPTGDPDMPIKLEMDGKPDGVILVLEGGTGKSDL